MSAVKKVDNKIIANNDFIINLNDFEVSLGEIKIMLNKKMDIIEAEKAIKRI